jgi:superfamily II RNA helicase
VVTVKDVVSLRGEVPRIASVDNLHPPPEMPLKPGQSRSGDSVTGLVVRQIPLTPSLEDDAPEVYAQQQRMQAVEAQLENHPVHQWGNRTTILKRQKRVTAIQTELSDRQEKLDQQSHRHWEEFLSLIDILRDFNCLTDLNPTPLGQAAAAIRGDNELWLGLALMSGELDQLAPHHLAVACAALVTEISRPDSWTRYSVPTEVEEALMGLRSIRRRLFQLQRRHQVMLPVWLEYELVGLVEQWALGVDWLELCSNTNLDEGDVVRLLRRTLDFLAQIPHVPHVPKEVKTNAYRAIQLLDRFPVNEAIE